MSTNATAAAAAKIAKPKKAKSVSHAKPAQEQAALPLPTVENRPEFGELAIAQIVVHEQVRKEFDETALNELAMDIAMRGILQPLTVRRHDGQYVLVAGERRLRAARLAQLESVPVLITTMDDAEHKLAQIAENIQRADLSLKEEANAIALLYAELKNIQAVGARVHKSKSWVSKRLSLANGLGYWASSLMNEGITEDIELLQTVDKLERATSGSNACWALCEKIKKGEAGREDAREALRRATEPKPTGNEPGAPKEQAAADPLAASKWFREWLKKPYENSDYEACLLQLVNRPGAAEHIERLRNAVESHRQQMIEAREAVLLSLAADAKAVRDKMGAMLLHEAWEQFAKSKDPFK